MHHHSAYSEFQFTTTCAGNPLTAREENFEIATSAVDSELAHAPDANPAGHKAF